ncbi:unnamed protein product [Urochloa humidicola]
MRLPAGTRLALLLTRRSLSSSSAASHFPRAHRGYGAMLLARRPSGTRPSHPRAPPTCSSTVSVDKYEALIRFGISHLC